MTRVTITIDNGGHQEHYARVSDGQLVLPLLCGAFTAAFGAHKAEAETVAATLTQLAQLVRDMGLGETP